MYYAQYSIKKKQQYQMESKNIENIQLDCQNYQFLTQDILQKYRTALYLKATQLFLVQNSQLTSIEAQPQLQIIEQNLQQPKQTPQTTQLHLESTEKDSIYPTTIKQTRTIDNKSIINLTYDDELSPKSSFNKHNKQNKNNSVPVKFKKHKKLLTQRNKQFQEQRKNEQSYLRLTTEERVNHKYDPIHDQSLVQYFYPKKSSVVRELEHISVKNSQEKSPRMNLKLCKSQKHQLPKKYKVNKNQPYEVSNQCGRNASFNEYDLISCQLSLSPPSKLKNKSINNLRSDRFPSKQKKKEQLLMFKKRMVNLQTKVFEKVPYLMKMGVMFKRNMKK